MIGLAFMKVLKSKQHNYTRHMGKPLAYPSGTFYYHVYEYVANGNVIRSAHGIGHNPCKHQIGQVDEILYNLNKSSEFIVVSGNIGTITETIAKFFK